MKIPALVLPIALAAAACGGPTDPSTEPVSFTHAVSFGFCDPRGYCSSRLELRPRLAVMTWESRERGAVVERRALDAAQWSRVSGALDPEGLRALPDVVGCPDCADGGAESLRVAFGDGQADAVTFEYGDEVAGIEALVDALREIRSSFDPPPPSALP